MGAAGTAREVGPATEVFVERKTHHEGDAESVKERYRIQVRHAHSRRPPLKSMDVLRLLHFRRSGVPVRR